MNPGYAGRSNLPDNLKKLFRSVSMTRPDSKLIAQVMLLSQGFAFAEDLSENVVSFFNSCKDKLTSESHYDFGLRALKSVIVTAGAIIKGVKTRVSFTQKDEMAIIIQSIRYSVAPKLISADIQNFKS
jgi:dynein heavy chain 1